MVNSEIMRQWVDTHNMYKEDNCKQVYYVSMEFLIGSLLESNLLNCGMLQISNEVLESIGKNPQEVYSQEHDAGLGNGGLGRLAACFMDSLASLSYPGHGFGIRYRCGVSDQRNIQGNLIALPDYWLKDNYA